MFSLLLLAAVATFFATPGTPRTTTYWAPGATNVVTYYSTLPVECTNRDPQDCEVRFARYSSWNGVYWVCPEASHSQAIEVLCDMRGGGWTVVLKRFDGSVNFNRPWDEMKQLVGDLTGEFWLGLEDVHRLTTSGQYSLRVEIRKGSNYWTEIYNSFSLSGEAENYRLRVEGFDSVTSTNKVPALGRHNNLPFSTSDRDNTGHRFNGFCTRGWEGPDWFNRGCSAYINPFGLYPPRESGEGLKMQWRVNAGDINPTELIWKIKSRGP